MKVLTNKNDVLDGKEEVVQSSPEQGMKYKHRRIS